MGSWVASLGSGALGHGRSVRHGDGSGRWRLAVVADGVVVLVVVAVLGPAGLLLGVGVLSVVAVAVLVAEE